MNEEDKEIIFVGLFLLAIICAWFALASGVYECSDEFSSISRYNESCVNLPTSMLVCQKPLCWRNKT
jgi:hypothetical protein